MWDEIAEEVSRDYPDVTWIYRRTAKTTWLGLTPGSHATSKCINVFDLRRRRNAPLEPGYFHKFCPGVCSLCFTKIFDIICVFFAAAFATVCAAL